MRPSAQRKVKIIIAHVPDTNVDVKILWRRTVFFFFWVDEVASNGSSSSVLIFAAAGYFYAFERRSLRPKLQMANKKVDRVALTRRQRRRRCFITSLSSCEASQRHQNRRQRLSARLFWWWRRRWHPLSMHFDRRDSRALTSANRCRQHRSAHR